MAAGFGCSSIRIALGVPLVRAPTEDLVFNRIAVKVLGIPGDQDAVARAEKALPGVIGIVEGPLARGQWMLGNDFSLVDCAYTPYLNAIEKAGFGYTVPKVQAYLDTCRARPAWKQTPKVPGL